MIKKTALLNEQGCFLFFKEKKRKMMQCQADCLHY